MESSESGSSAGDATRLSAGGAPGRPGAGPPRDARFVPGAEIGRGGLGRVIEAEDTEIGRTVALKLLLPGAPLDLVERFRWEGRITGRLEHPSIVPVHEIGRLGTGELYIAMKRIAGRDLQRVIREGAWPLRRLVESLRDACRAMAYAHSRGVVHRDLKPANVMVGDFGETLVVDWGLARAQGESGVAGSGRGAAVARAGEETHLTLEGDVMGTPAYMPPEQALGHLADIDARSDVYSLGAILYEILAGRPPFDGLRVEEVLARAGSGVVPAPSSVRPAPPDLEAICVRAMAPRREDRFPDAGAMAAELELWLEGTRERERRRALAEAEIARAKTAMSERKRLAAEAAAAAVRTKELLWSIPKWEGAAAKAPLWEARDRAEASRRGSLDAYADALGALASALSHVPDNLEARALRARLAWEKFLEAEAASDDAEMVVNRRIAESYHDGTLAEELKDEGVVTIRSRAYACDCLVKGREVSPGELAVHGWHPWSGRRLEGGGPPFAEGAEPAETLRLRVHAASCRPSEVPGARVWAWRYEEIERVQVPVTRGESGPPPPGGLLRAVFGESPFAPRGPGRFLGVTPLRGLPLPIGSWLLVLAGPDGRLARTLVRSARSGESDVDATLLAPEEIPPGFLPVLESAAIFQGDREVPTSGPAIVARIPDVFVARDIVTCAEYAGFLDALPPDEARRRVPRRDTGPSEPWWPLVGGRWTIPAGSAPAAGPASARFTGDSMPAWDPGWPVCCISWFDAVAFARWRSLRDGRAYSLPVGEQWEAAARGVDGRPYPWGWRFDHSWCNNNDALSDGPRPARPDEFPRDESPWGVRGLAGNVMEKTLGGSGGQFPTRREERGGGWSRAAGLARCATRIASSMTSVERYAGFRLSALLRLGERAPLEF